MEIKVKALDDVEQKSTAEVEEELLEKHEDPNTPCLLYTSPSPRDRQKSRMPSSA